MCGVVDLVSVICGAGECVSGKSGGAGECVIVE